LSFGDYDALQELCAERTTYLYTPTLRDDDADLLGEALPDLAALSAALEPTNGVLLLKLHPFSAASVAEAVEEYDNIVVWPQELDLYPVLADMDCLITDYSSLLYDYVAFADSGVVIYAFDYDRYVAQDRDLAFPLEDNIVGSRGLLRPAVPATAQRGGAGSTARRPACRHPDAALGGRRRPLRRWPARRSRTSRQTGTARPPDDQHTSRG
jgi:hypothetical protein